MKIHRFGAGSYEAQVAGKRYSVESIEQKGRWDVYEIITDEDGNDDYELLYVFDTKRDAVDYLKNK